MFKLHNEAEQNAKEMGVDIEKFKKGLGDLHQLIFDIADIKYTVLGEGRYKLEGRPEAKDVVRNVLANLTVNLVRIISNGNEPGALFDTLLAFAAQEELNRKMLTLMLKNNIDSEEENENAEV